MPARIFLITVALAISGCTGLQQRPDMALCYELSTNSTACGKSSLVSLGALEQTGNPMLAFVEFDDKGAPYDQANIDSVLHGIETLNSADEKGLLLVVFIHGWNHNAAQTDRNVMEFKSFLLSLNKQEQTLTVGKPRKVVGVYMGWQGKASDNPILSLFSYREKKDLGLETGKQSVTPILKRLSIIRKSEGNNRLILVGHSFGGGVLYSAVAADLQERLENPRAQSIKLFGDLVVLVNPAIEAQRFVVIHDLLDKDFAQCTPISMVSFTSEADTALSKDFPLGMKAFYWDQLKGNPGDALLTTAYGRYAEFSKYELRLDADITVPASLSKEVFEAAVPTWEAFRVAQSSFDLGGIKLSRKSDGMTEFAWQPLLNVLVDKALIQEHNEIWDPKFQYFLRGFIGMEFAKSRQCR